MIQRHTCDNGLRIVTERIPSVRSVALGIWVGTGSKYESDVNNGISHFLEHMFFKGTATRSAKEIAETFDEIGGNVNAFTSKSTPATTHECLISMRRLLWTCSLICISTPSSMQKSWRKKKM